MIPVTVDVRSRSHEPVKVRVIGEPTIERKHVVVANAEMTQALAQAIEASQLFGRVDDAATQGFLLEWKVLGYEPPTGSLTATATMTSHWKLTRVSTGDVVFEDFFRTTHAATVGDAFDGMIRLRKANEGMVRDAIAEGLEGISRSNL